MNKKKKANEAAKVGRDEEKEKKKKKIITRTTKREFSRLDIKWLGRLNINIGFNYANYDMIKKILKNIKYNCGRGTISEHRQ